MSNLEKVYLLKIGKRCQDGYGMDGDETKARHRLRERDAWPSVYEPKLSKVAYTRGTNVAVRREPAVASE